MNVPATSSKSGRVRDWLAPRQRRMAVPSWLLSLCFHGTVLVVASQIAGWTPIRPDIAGNGGEDFREVGIYTGEPGGGAGQDGRDSGAGIVEATPTDADTPPALDAIPALSATPPVPIALPETTVPNVIGAGGVAVPPGVASPFGRRLLQPSGTTMSGTGTGRPGVGSGTGTSVGAGTGGTTFIGARDEGRRFVYVIDRSGSMADYDAFLSAKSELITSVERLTEKQQFQVIFYNNTPLTLLTRDQRFPMFYGTDAQRLQVSEQVRMIEPRDGTLHLPALLKALDFHPDVVFFLTDGAEPPLTASELDKVRTRNREGAHIHCIEFGEGPVSKVNKTGNFLVKLAAANHGQYIYRDVTQLHRK